MKEKEKSVVTQAIRKIKVKTITIRESLYEELESMLPPSRSFEILIYELIDRSRQLDRIQYPSLHTAFKAFIHCPNCGYEYDSEFEYCPDCKAKKPG